MNYHGAITQALVDELLGVIYKYEETMLLPTALGCLDLVKAHTSSNSILLTPTALRFMIICFMRSIR